MNCEIHCQVLRLAAFHRNVVGDLPLAIPKVLTGVVRICLLRVKEGGLVLDVRQAPTDVFIAPN